MKGSVKIMISSGRAMIPNYYFDTDLLSLARIRPFPDQVERRINNIRKVFICMSKPPLLVGSNGNLYRCIYQEES